MENHQYISQFKTVGELQETIETLIREHRTAKGKSWVFYLEWLSHQTLQQHI